jgi:hypothetical protein
MTGDDRYKSQDGGLYAGGKNEPPREHLEAALQQAKLIQPLDVNGKPSSDGKVVMISVGMSNTMREFSAFVRLANADPAKSPKLVIVDGAQGGMDAKAWAVSGRPDRPGSRNPWDKILLCFFGPSIMAIFPVAALDDGRCHWLPLPHWACAVGFAVVRDL